MILDIEICYVKCEQVMNPFERFYFGFHTFILMKSRFSVQIFPCFLLLVPSFLFQFTSNFIHITHNSSVFPHLPFPLQPHKCGFYLKIIDIFMQCLVSLRHGLRSQRIILSLKFLTTIH